MQKQRAGDRISSAPHAVSPGLREEATQLLQGLIRLDTVNPPGNETQAAELLREYLAQSGLECELFAREPHRANVVARIKGGDGRSLAFLSHTDTVLADPAEWDRDPWSGDLVEGSLSPAWTSSGWPRTGSSAEA